MKSITHRIKCPDCPSHITLEILSLQFAERGKDYVERIAELEQWAGGRCPVHREKR